MGVLRGVEVFKVGEHTDSSGHTRVWSRADLTTIADTYNNQPSSERHIAPLTLGHPADDAPALGWVERLYVKGNSLFADFTDVADKFIEALRQGLYKTRSIALYPNKLLRHIGWLGAQPPAVKGLSEVSFDDPSLFQLRVVQFNSADKYITFSEHLMFSERNARSQQYNIGVKAKGFDALPPEYQHLTAEDFADPVNLRFPMTREYLPSMLGTWSRVSVRSDYTEAEQRIITARLLRAAALQGFSLNNETWLQTMQSSHSSDFSSDNFFSDMNVTFFIQMLEELQSFIAEQYGEEIASGIAVKIAELQSKYELLSDEHKTDNESSGDQLALNSQQAAASSSSVQSTQPTAPLSAGAYAELEILRKKVSQLERNELLTNVGLFCERMIKQGSLLPAQRDKAIELMVALHSRGEGTFSEGTRRVQKPLLTAFQDFVASFKQIDFSEQATLATAHAAGSLSFSDEAALNEADVLLKRTMEFMDEQSRAGKQMDFVQALRLVEKQTISGGK